ncbi:MAG: GntR family transcriptional regulator [Spirochaetales bacterium]|nr:GntR family transcriptional regulator [Spirochaetales bacterium]
MDMEKEKTLAFTLDPKSGVPYYKQIILQIEMAISDGRLVSGDQLPTVRGLAVDLRINPNTVARAYNELEIRGVVNTQQGTGTFISDKTISMTEVERERILAGLAREFIAKAQSYGFSKDDVLSFLVEEDPVKRNNQEVSDGDKKSTVFTH